MATDNNKTIGVAALEVAITQLGVSEEPKGSNKGPVVNEYLRSVGLKPGYPWCQSFVYWCFGQAAPMGGMVNPVPRTGGVRDAWNKVPAAGKVDKLHVQSHPERVLPGAQFFLGFSNGNGHTGIVERVEFPFYYTIEGNSNSDGSREGWQVVRHCRRLDAKELLGFVNY
jgi:hypothetical protein